MMQWPHIVGNLATYVCIYKIENESLTLGVANAAWMHEMHALSDALLARINQNIKGHQIKHLRFKYVARNTGAPPHTYTRTPIARTTRPLSQKEQSALQRVADKELSASLHQFLMRCQQAHQS